MLYKATLGCVIMMKDKQISYFVLPIEQIQSLINWTEINSWKHQHFSAWNLFGVADTIICLCQCYFLFLSCVQFQGWNHNWSEPIVTIQILFASDKSKHGHVIQSWLLKPKGKTAGVSGQNFFSLTKEERKRKNTRKKSIYPLPLIFYFAYCPKRIESLEVFTVAVLQPWGGWSRLW